MLGIRTHRVLVPALVLFCSERLVETVGLSLVKGRVFSGLDVEQSRHVALVNEALAKTYFGSDEPLGRTIRLARLATLPVPVADPTFEVIGVVRDFANQGPREQATPQTLLPFTLRGPAVFGFVVRTSDEPMRALAIDGSVVSKKAVQFLLRSIRPWEDVSDQEPLTVTVAHVMPFLKYPELREAGKAMVEECANKLSRAGYLIDQVPRLGNPADEILNIAQERKADLIVTGAKGLGAIGRFLLGSVSTRVVQHATCSVLVVR